MMRSFSLIIGFAFLFSLINLGCGKPAERTDSQIKSNSYEADERSRADIIEYALSGVGSNYVWGGNYWVRDDRSEGGADCSGFAIRTWAFPYDAPPEEKIDRIGNTSTLYYEMTNWDKVDRDEALAGDILVRVGDPGHAMVFHEFSDDGNVNVIQAGGRGSGINATPTSVSSSYIVVRRHNLTDGSNGIPSANNNSVKPNEGNNSSHQTNNNSSNNSSATNSSSPSKTGFFVVEVTASSLNARTGYSTSYNILGSAERGTQLVSIGTKNGWHNVDFENEWAWMSGKYLKVIKSFNSLDDAQAYLDNGNKDYNDNQIEEDDFYSDDL